MKTLIKYLIIFYCLIFFHQGVYAAPKSAHITASVGNQFSFSGIRIGGSSWEIGLLVNRLPGIVFLQDINDRFYTEFGLVLTPVVDVALLAGINFDFFRYGFSNLRLSASAYSSYNNYSSGQIQLGINMGF